MIDYTIKRHENTYTLTNNSVDDYTVEIYKTYNCDTELKFFEFSLPASENYIIKFREDAIYRIVIKSIIEETEFTIKHFVDLQESIITGIENYVCDGMCGCKSCIYPKDPCDLLMLKAKMDVYKNLVYPEAEDYFHWVYFKVNCLLNKPTFCSVKDEIITGESKNDLKIPKILIGLDYLAMYFYEINNVCLTEDKDYITEKFQIEKIFCCLQELGINIDEIKKYIDEQILLQNP